jgi:hypothetical protein
MFLLVQRTDTMPEVRVLINTDHIIAVLPVFGGTKTKFHLANGEAWEIGLPFTQAQALFRVENAPAPRVASAS